MRQRVATLHSGMAVLAAPLTPGDYALVPKGEQAGPGLGRPGIAVRLLAHRSGALQAPGAHSCARPVMAAAAAGRAPAVRRPAADVLAAGRPAAAHDAAAAQGAGSGARAAGPSPAPRGRGIGGRRHAGGLAAHAAVRHPRRRPRTPRRTARRKGRRRGAPCSTCWAAWASPGGCAGGGCWSPSGRCPALPPRSWCRGSPEEQG